MVGPLHCWSTIFFTRPAPQELSCEGHKSNMRTFREPTDVNRTFVPRIALQIFLYGHARPIFL
jgi:hypothetical protein